MANSTVRPATSLIGEVALPGDKSISHRAAMIASIAEGETRIFNFAASEDCASTLGCLRSLGVDIQRQADSIVIRGAGKHGLRMASQSLDCGNSGTTMRLLSGILAGQAFETKLIGDSSLSERPMRRVIDPLDEMGAQIVSRDGKAPLAITGRLPLRSITYAPPVASAQIKSCVLLAGLYAEGITTVIEEIATRDHTERMLRWFGAEVDTNGANISISGESVLKARDLRVPADISAAAFFIAAAAGLEGSDISMQNVGLNPSRIAIVEVLRTLGVDIEISDRSDSNNEPVGSIRVRGGLPTPKSGQTPVIRGSTIANLIDEVPILAILGTQLPYGVEIRDAGELRVKESDRIAAVARNLEKMGASATEYDDGLRIDPSKLHGASIETYGDHRIAMAFAVAGLFAAGETEIVGSECADVSFPGFFETLDGVVR